MKTQEFSIIIIGSGQAGNPLAKAFAKSGKKVAIIEESEIGGCCINRGCTPTKTMIASGKISYLAKNAQKFGINVKEVSTDLEKIIERKKHIVNSFRKSSEDALNLESNIEIFKGTAQFIDSHTIEITQENNNKNLIHADFIFINTGATPTIPKIVGIDSIPYLTSTTIMDLTHLPQHLIVLGGGYIGLEFAQLFHRLGSKVTIIQRNAYLLPNEDVDVSEEIKAILEEEGLVIYCDAKTQAISKIREKIKVTFLQGDKEIDLEGSHLLIATGRKANIERLQLEKSGVLLNPKGFIEVNDKLETNVKNVYALGDVKGGPAFTHISYDDYRIVKANLIDGKNVSLVNRFVPYTVFNDPQVAGIGLNEKKAKELKKEILIAKMPMSHVARAIEVGDTRGFIKVIIDAKTNEILGCTIIGTEAGEIMSMIEIAMLGKLQYSVLQNAIFAHPTYAEALNNLFNNLG